MDYWTKVRQRWNSMIGNYHDVEFVINGFQLTPHQIEAFKRLTGFVILEPGRYWLDPNTGNMGVEGVAFPCMNIFQHAIQRIRLDFVSNANQNLNRLLDKPGPVDSEWVGCFI